MKRKVMSVVLVAIMLTQLAPVYAEYSYENAREELSWIYEQVPEEIDESSEGYRPDKVWKEFYVSNTGKDTNDGSVNAPFATIKRAQEEVRKVNDDMQGDIVVHIESGEYYMDEKIVFGVDDSGTNGYNIVWLGDKENMPIISGGKKLDTMQPSSEYPGIYEVKVDYPDRILNLYVNGHSRELAAGNSLVYGQKRPDYMATNEWYAKYPLDRRLDEEYFDPNTSKEVDGVYVKKEDISIYDNLEDVFVVYNPSYRTYVLGIEEIFENPDNKDQYIVRYTGGWEFLSISTMALWPSGDKPFRVKNAFELLDSPGEFYFNRKTQTLYYMPYEHEDMATAKVIMPYQENLLSIRGDDRENKVHNIVFEGLEFAYTMWNRWSYNGFRSDYGATDLNHGADGLQSGMPAYAVSVGFADNITFKNNFFFGIGGNALWVPSETKYLKVLGNAFADIGNTGFLVDGYNGNVLDMGNNNYYKNGTPNEEQKNKPLELTGTSYATFEVSYDDAIRGSNGKFMLGKHVLVNMDRWESWGGPNKKTWVDEYEYPENAWRSDPKAPAMGGKSWIKYDFGSAYSVDKIALAFAENIVQDEEKTNYEILLSNDMYFSEGQYKTVVQQTTPANTIQEYEIKETEKYRYMMIRTMGATPLAVSGIWAFSYDLKPYPAESNSSYIYVQNNKFSRMGVNVENSSAITMNFATWKVVTHNEIDTTAYSGMQLLGVQSASERGGHKHGFIAYNHITNTNKLMPDGSGFYVHGYAPYNICEGNYLQDNGVGVFGYYTDGAAAAWTFVNNIAEDVPTSYSFYYKDATGKSSTMGNISRLMYANHDAAISVEVPAQPGNEDYYWPLIQNDPEKPRVYLRGQPTKEVYAIKRNAGLEPEFEWLRDLIPDDTDHNLDPYLYYVEATHESAPASERRKYAMKYEAENIIKNGVFGVGLGKFDVMYREKLIEAVNDLNGTNNTNSDEKDIALRKLLREVAENVERYSLEKTLQLCKELADVSVVDDSKTPGFDTVSSENLKAFTDVIAEIENRMKETYDYFDEFEMLTALETAYNNFNDGCRSADIEAVIVPDAENIVIDKEKLKVDICVPSTINLDDVKDVEYILSGTAEIGRIFYDDDKYSKGLDVPIYCKEVGKYKHWTVTVKHSEPIERSFVSADSFVNASLEGIKTKKSKAGCVLAANPYPNMSKTYDTERNGATVLFKPFAVNDTKKFTFIVGASFVEGYSLNNKTEPYNRIELEFNNDIVNLYSVVKGKKTLIKSAKSNIKYNEKNEFSYSFKKINETECLTLELNGNVIVNDALVEKINGYYFGIYSPIINVEIFDVQ